jgi:uncharacterized membrane protein
MDRQQLTMLSGVGLGAAHNPPGGAMGHAVAALFGADPKRQIDDDMMRVKTLIETVIRRTTLRRITVNYVNPGFSS